MLYEEKWINGRLYCRSKPHGPWKIKARCTPDETPTPPPWTEDDEKKLATLIDRKAKAEHDKYTAVFHIVNAFRTCDMSSDEITQELIKAAPAIRAALKAFDVDDTKGEAPKPLTIYHPVVCSVQEPDRLVWEFFCLTREKAVKAMNGWFDNTATPTIRDDHVWTTMTLGTTYEGRILEELAQ